MLFSQAFVDPWRFRECGGTVLDGMRKGRMMKTTKGDGNAAVLSPAEAQEAALPAEPSNGNSKAQATNGKAKDDDVLSFWDFAASLGDRWFAGNLKT